MSRDWQSDEKVALSWGATAADAPRYSMWRPTGSNIATVMETDADGQQSWLIMIHNDVLGEAVEAFLERHGAPVFPTVQERTSYLREFETRLQAGLAPPEARDSALTALGLPPFQRVNDA